jgi:hypothetical protein
MDVTVWMLLMDTQISTLTFMGEDCAKHPLRPDDCHWYSNSTSVAS